MLWVVATNLGFFPGQALGDWLGAGFAQPGASAIDGACFGLLVGVGQELVLARHVASARGWGLGTAVGWALGAGLGAWLLARFLPGLTPEGVAWILAIGFFAGAIVGVPQYAVLRRSGLERGWVPISSLGWGVFFPGMVTGWVLALRLRDQAFERTLPASDG